MKRGTEQHTKRKGVLSTKYPVHRINHRPSTRKPQKGIQHDYPPKRRGFLIDRLPLYVQVRIFQAYGRGDSYKKISADLLKRGHKISENCLSRYWRRVWRDEFETLRLGWVVKEFLKKALTKKPGSSNAKMAEELLYTAAVGKVKELKQEPPVTLFKEGREQGKAAGKEAEPEKPRRKASPVVQAREIRRRWRRLYGMDTDGDEEKKSKRKRNNKRK